MAHKANIRIALGQIRILDEDMLRFAQQLGVTGIQLFPNPNDDRPYWSYDQLCELQDACREHGLTLESVASHLYTGIMLGLPNRDEQIEHCCETIRNMGKAGVPILGYDFMPNSVWRTSVTQAGRGGSSVTAYDHSIVSKTNHHEQRRFALNRHPDVDDTFARAAERPISAEEMWQNYEYFLRAVLPVAEEAGVRLALHPDDPPVDSLGGVARIFNSVDAFKRAMALADSDAWGILLCLGTFSEMPGGSVNAKEAIQYFGPKGKICYVHFRDVQGTVPSFAECFLGEGNYEPFEMMSLLADSGFDGFIMDDHVPQLVGDTPWAHRGRAHAVGYMQGLLAAIAAS